jgi:hypothetical protein
MPVGAMAITGGIERISPSGKLRPDRVAAVWQGARSVSRDIGAGRF